MLARCTPTFLRISYYSRYVSITMEDSVGCSCLAVMRASLTHMMIKTIHQHRSGRQKSINISCSCDRAIGSKILLYFFWLIFEWYDRWLAQLFRSGGSLSSQYTYNNSNYSSIPSSLTCVVRIIVFCRPFCCLRGGKIVTYLFTVELFP